jgi:phage/plasmid-associated DNA primase
MDSGSSSRLPWLKDRAVKVQVRARTVQLAVSVLVPTVKEIYGFLLIGYGDNGKV